MGHADSFGRHIPGRRFPLYNVTGLNKSRCAISVGVFLCVSAFCTLRTNRVSIYEQEKTERAEPAFESQLCFLRFLLFKFLDSRVT
jgi:hypothetical protein